jgi:NADP-dependent 3-hydroxy acid dehydrogenase YdfG
MRKKLIAITGASSGIGAEIATIFSTNGYPVALIARNKLAMEELKLPNSICLKGDVLEPETIKNAIAIAEKKFGPVDCLINNAGYAKSGDFVSVGHDHNLTMIEVNILGAVNCIEAVLPGMRERRHGTIINISSVADRNSRPQLAVYAASKAALKSLSESLRADNAKYGIRVSNVAPAKILTPLLIASNNADSQAIPAEEFAQTILWIYQHPQNICIRDLVFAPTEYEG